MSGRVVAETSLVAVAVASLLSLAVAYAIWKGRV
jgi:multidrug transporter EmrE-like cation transporter